MQRVGASLIEILRNALDSLALSVVQGEVILDERLGKKDELAGALQHGKIV